MLHDIMLAVFFNIDEKAVDLPPPPFLLLTFGSKFNGGLCKKRVNVSCNKIRHKCIEMMSNLPSKNLFVSILSQFLFYFFVKRF